MYKNVKSSLNMVDKTPKYVIKTEELDPINPNTPFMLPETTKSTDFKSLK